MGEDLKNSGDADVARRFCIGAGVAFARGPSDSAWDASDMIKSFEPWAGGGLLCSCNEPFAY